MLTFTITPDAPFSLAAAAAFGFGPSTGRPRPDAGEMRLAFVTDDLHGQAAVHLTQRDDGTIDGSLAGDADPAAVRAQVCRILCLDHPGREWLAVGGRDPVIGELQAAHPGFRPVLFHSPYEAAAWSIISARRRRAQAAVIRTRLAQAFGISFDAGGEPADAFPTPRRLLGVEEFRGLEPARIGRLHAAPGRPWTERSPGTAGGSRSRAGPRRAAGAAGDRADLCHAHPAARDWRDRRAHARRAAAGQLRGAVLRHRA